jgi:hypothetical protein
MPLTLCLESIAARSGSAGVSPATVDISRLPNSSVLREANGWQARRLRSHPQAAKFQTIPHILA